MKSFVHLVLLAFLCSPALAGFFHDLAEKINGITNTVKTVYAAYNSVPNATTSCSACIALVTAMKPVVPSIQNNRNCILAIVDKACKATGVQNPAVCDSATKEWQDEASYLVPQLLLKPEQFCKFLLQDCGETSKWTIPIPARQRRLGPRQLKHRAVRQTADNADDTNVDGTPSGFPQIENKPDPNEADRAQPHDAPSQSSAPKQAQGAEDSTDAQNSISTTNTQDAGPADAQGVDPAESQQSVQTSPHNGNAVHPQTVTETNPQSSVSTKNPQQTAPPRNAEGPKQTYRVVHLADIHVDVHYTEGTEVFCDHPQCCRKRQRENGGIKQPAGKWGSIGKCDIPMALLENLFDHLARNEKFDYIIWTGDLPPHDIYNQTKQDQLNAYNKLVEMLLKHFPDKLIFSAMGNHESSPADSFPPHDGKIPKELLKDWLYDAVADHWTKWVPKSAEDAIRKTASYAVAAFDKLRIISLNMNYGYTQNFFLYLNETDPDGTLAWLIGQLLEAEKAEDKVHIIGHIPPGLDILPAWSGNYYKIINRFQNTIAAQFFGHTHGDQFQVFYEDGDYKKRATSIAYIAPSVTTYDKFFPAYKVYTIDAPTWRVLDYETRYVDLRKANKVDKVEWELLYTAKEAYGMKDLSPASWSDLISRALTDRALAEKMIAHYYRRNDIYCDETCTLDFLCELRTARSKDKSFCADFPIGYKPHFRKKSHSSGVHVSVTGLLAPPLLPVQCKKGKRTLGQIPQFKHENCQSLASECQKYECGQICEGIIVLSGSLGLPEQLDSCRAAVCQVAPECCCRKEKTKENQEVTVGS